MKWTKHKEENPARDARADSLKIYRRRRGWLEKYLPGGKDEAPTDGDEQPKIYHGRRRIWKKLLVWGGITFAVLLLALFVAVFSWLKVKESQMRVSGLADSLDGKVRNEPVTTLVMGVDKGSVVGEEESESRTDIMMLVSIDKASGKAAVISIPRDTRVEIPGESGYNKINAAHALGGPELAIKTVKEFTGLDINHYVIIDFEGFKNIVNATGGVPIHLDTAINDEYAGDLPAGDQVLNGDMALVLVRARHDVNAVPAGDLDRVRNQRKFIQAMLSKIAGERNPFKLKDIIDAASVNIKTDLTFLEMLSMGRWLQGGDDKVQMATVPGSPDTIGGVWYFIADTEEFRQLLSDFETRTEPGDENQDKEVTSSSARERIQLAVLNGSGVQGLAASVAGRLQEEGYSGIETGNAKSVYEKTTIYYSGTDSTNAGLVAGDLSGADEPILESNSSLVSDYGVDVLVVLGEDYESPGSD